MKVTFNEKVTKESAENLANYEIKVDEKDVETLDIVSVEWDSDDENFVYVITEPQERTKTISLRLTELLTREKPAIQ